MDSKLDYILRKFKNRNNIFEKDDLLQEIYLYLWIEWNNGNLEGKNERYILKRCYFYFKNFMRKNKSQKFISLDELMEKNICFEKVSKKNSYLIDLEEIYDLLNEREKKVVNLIIEGYTTREIGQTLGISHVMVIKIIKKIKSKVTGLKKIEI
ncbi:MAG: sigma-70 family RNA polymerase sigma factor [Candidatus Omnitrophica bacterium]|nr:sigma-70 family RNA polymerase sigma factor [Candidatus Omnitrophota bacterium]